MMSFESFASEGVIIKPQVFLIYGPNGVGKTTLACSMGNAAIVDLEDGSRNIKGVKRYHKAAFPDWTTLKDFLFQVHSGVLLSDKDTLVIDSLEVIERLASQHVCKDSDVDSIEKAYGGFGKGFIRMRELMGDLMHLLQMIRDERAMSVVIVAHSQVKTHTDPTSNQTYDRYTLRANDKFAAVVKDLSDTVLFIKPKVYTEKSKQNPQKTSASSAGERVIHTEWSAAFDAKRRYSLPSELVFTLETIGDVVAILKGSESDVLENEIDGLLMLVKDETKMKAASQKKQDAKGDVVKLRAIKERLLELTSQA